MGNILAKVVYLVVLEVTESNYFHPRKLRAKSYHAPFSWRCIPCSIRVTNGVLLFQYEDYASSKTSPLLSWLPFKYSTFSIPSCFESCNLKWLIYLSLGQQKWEIIPSSSERSCHSKAWFSIKKDRIVIKTKIFSIWSVFVCGAGGSKRKRITAFASKPNPASNLICLRCYIYSDNEDSKRVSNAVIWNDLTSIETVNQRRNRFFYSNYLHILDCWNVSASCSITVAKRAIARRQISVINLKKIWQRQACACLTFAVPRNFITCFVCFACAITRDVDKVRISQRTFTKKAIREKTPEKTNTSSFGFSFDWLQ